VFAVGACEPASLSLLARDWRRAGHIGLYGQRIYVSMLAGGGIRA